MMSILVKILGKSSESFTSWLVGVVVGSKGNNSIIYQLFLFENVFIQMFSTIEYSNS